MKIAIAAAAGNIGFRTARTIAAAGVQTILLGRDANRLQSLKINGAIIKATDLSDPNSVIEATAGADAMLWLVPPILNYSSLKNWYEKVTRAGVEAVRANNIKRVVAVSSIGADSRGNLGTVTYAGQMERAFRKLKINFVALRPGYFMENFLSQADSLKTNGYFTFTYAPDHDIPFISTDDIGDAAAQYLLDEGCEGQSSRNVMGPANITLSQAAQIISEVSAKSVAYRQVSLDEVKQQLSELGATINVQRELTDLFQALGDPNGIYAAPRTTEAFTPTTFEQFVRTKLLSAICN